MEIKLNTIQNITEYIGQDNIKTLLNININGVIKRKELFPHTFIYGAAGHGKTTLARIIANKFNRTLIEIIGSSITKEELKQILWTLPDTSFLFIDEVHSLDEKAIELLYTAMTDYKLNGMDIAKFTLIAATTDLGNILKKTKPFYDRFGLILELEQYKIEDLKAIIKIHNKKLYPKELIDDDEVSIIAENSRYSPREAIRFLRARIYAERHIREVLPLYNVIHKGITFQDVKLMLSINLNGPLSIDSICAILNTGRDNYIYFIEPFLLKEGYIRKSSRGRDITSEGRKILSYINTLTTVHH